MKLHTKHKLMLLIALVLFSSASLADKLSESEMSYHSQITHFRATKSDSKFVFKDPLGTRSLEIKKCNQKLIESFWNEMVKSIESLQSSSASKTETPVSNAWIKYENIQFPVLEFEKGFQFFNNIPKKSHGLLIESGRLCKTK